MSPRANTHAGKWQFLQTDIFIIIGVYRDRVSWSWDDKSGSRELEFQIKVHIVTYLLPPLPTNAVRGPSRCLVARRPELSTPHVEAECRLCRAVTEIIVGCQPAHLFSCFTHRSPQHRTMLPGHRRLLHVPRTSQTYHNITDKGGKLLTIISI